MKSIPLTKGFHALVSDEDYERAMEFKWYASVESRGTKVYAIRWARKEERIALGFPNRTKLKIRLHRFVLNQPPLPGPDALVVEHKNGDGLDCTRENLELITQEENMNRVPRWKKKGMKVSEVDPFL